MGHKAAAGSGAKQSKGKAAKGKTTAAKRAASKETAAGAGGNGAADGAQSGNGTGEDLLVTPLPRPKKKKKKKIDNDYYESELARLQIELVKLQEWIKDRGLKVVVVFEGRDAAGKGGVIKRITQSLNPRVCRVVALGTPTERERTQWYFQRYVPHLPAAGEMVLFDRSWYNRAGVERVMGFCTDEEYREFLRTCPEFERMLVRSGIILVKYWFSVSDEEQEKRRFQGRITDPTKRWKLSPMDLESRKPLVHVLQGQGRHVPLHRHQAGALVRGGRRRQEAGAAQLHLAPLVDDRLRGSYAQADQAAAAPAGCRLRAPAHRRADLRAG